MPLSCTKNNQPIYSFNLNDSEWDILRKENKQLNKLQFDCCDAKVILKTSPLGTKYFAHARKGLCSSAPESAEHILAKQHIIEGIKRTNWIPFSEYRDPDGNKWQADTFATKNKGKVAFEVQWSRQQDNETVRRHNRYKDSDVRAVWLFKQYDFISDKEIPAFQIRFDEVSKSFNVYLQSSKYMSIIAKNDKSWLPPIPLQDFIEGCLTGKLKHSPVIGKTIPLEITTTRKRCKRCKKNTNIITGVSFLVNEALPDCPNIHASIYTEGIEKWLHVWLPVELLKTHHIGRLKVRKSYMQVENEASYFSNGCHHCDGIQPKYYENSIHYQFHDEEESSIKLKILFTKELADIFWHGYINYWWFDRNTSTS